MVSAVFNISIVSIYFFIYAFAYFKIFGDLVERARCKARVAVARSEM